MSGTLIHPATEIEPHVIDARGQVAGRLASRVATLLMGKDQPHYAPHLIAGRPVVVEHVRALAWTGRKMEQKQYHRTSRYPGGLKTRKLSELWPKRPDQVFRDLVRLMLPANRLRNRLLKRLTITR